MCIGLSRRCLLCPSWVEHTKGTVMKIGFIGLGNMGKAMERNIARAGHQLTVYNRTRSRADEWRAGGARVAVSPYDAALNADVLITMLANDEAVEAVIFGTHRAAR
jgi:3-hydroxyisobutyrate dehydrogenase-like beta-hydroxyacid dehydrogenase